MRSRRCGLRACEALEDRHVLSTIVVTTLEDVFDIPEVPTLTDLPGDDGVVSLREAISVANYLEGADTVEFAAVLSGTSQITEGDLVVRAGQPINIEGPSRSIVTVDLQGVSFRADDDSDLFLAGLSITGGAPAFRVGKDVTVENVWLFSNTTVFLGSTTRFDRSTFLAIDSTLEDSPLTGSCDLFTTAQIVNSHVINSPIRCFGSNAIESSYVRDSVLSANGDLTITNSTVVNTPGSNLVSQVFGQRLTITDSVVTGNVRSLAGNEFGNHDGIVTIENSRIYGQVSNNSDGSDYTGGSVRIADSVIYGLGGTEDSYKLSGGIHVENSSLIRTGGIYAFDGQIINTTISGTEGPAISLITHSRLDDGFEINNSTIAGNGVGISFADRRDWVYVDIESSIVAGNDENLLVSSGTGPTPYFQSRGRNLFEDPPVGPRGVALGPGDIVVPKGTDVGLGPLDRSTGKPHHPLLPGSIAIGKGSNPLGKATDQLGNPRSIDGAFDIGAIEFSAPIVHADSLRINAAQTGSVHANLLANDRPRLHGNSISLESLEGSGGVGLGTYGSITWDADGSVSYQLNRTSSEVSELLPFQFLTESFVYTVFDGTASADGQVSITIRNDQTAGPATESDSLSVSTHFVRAHSNLLANDDENPTGTLSLVSINGFANSPATTGFGTIRWDATGEIEYVVDRDNPAVAGLLPGQSLTESLYYLAQDSTGSSYEAVKITIVNDPSSPFRFVGGPGLASNARNDDVDLGDLDGDGDLDAFITSRDGGNQIWLNDGTGAFTLNGQTPAADNNIYASLGDLDGDGDLDALVSTVEEVVVWENDGAAVFVPASRIAVDSAIDVALKDLDGDGDFDAFVAQANDPDLVLLNDGTGNLTDSGQRLGHYVSKGIELSDVDADGDLDAVIAQAGEGASAANRVWLNDGSASFVDSGQLLGASETQHVALGDLDGDGDVDAMSANSADRSKPNVVYFNDGSGTFVGQRSALGQFLDVSHCLGGRRQ